VNTDKWPRTKDLPENERAAFEKALNGQTRPMEHEDSYYPWDYDRWKAGPKHEADFD